MFQIVLDTNFFFTKGAQNIQKKMQEFADSKKFNFYTSDRVVEELKSITLDETVITVMTITDQQITSVEKTSRMKHPPQRADLSLLAVAKQVQVDKGAKIVLIVSNDYKLYQFTTQHYKQAQIKLLPVSIFCYQISKFSQNKSYWRGIGKRALVDYIKYNEQRTDIYNIHEIIKWIFEDLHTLLDKSISDFGLETQASNKDTSFVKILLESPKADISDRPFLSNIRNYIIKWKDIIDEEPEIEENPHLLVENERKQHAIRIRNQIQFWQEFLMGAINLSSVDQELIKSVIYPKLADLQELAIQYDLLLDNSDILPTRLYLFRQYSSYIDDNQKLFSAIRWSILYYLRIKNYEQAQLVYYASKRILELLDIEQEIQLQFMGYLLQKHLDNEDEILLMRKEIGKYHSSEADAFNRSLKELSNIFFIWGLYSEVYNILIYLLKHIDYDNTKDVITYFKRAMLCDQLQDKDTINVYPKKELMIELADEAGNDELKTYLQHMKEPKIPKNSMYIGESYNNDNIPTFVKNGIECLFVDRKNQYALVYNNRAIFEVEVSSHVINYDVIIRPYLYKIRVKSNTTIEFVKPVKNIRWVEARIQADDPTGIAFVKRNEDY